MMWGPYIKTLLATFAIVLGGLVAATVVLNPYGNLPVTLAGPHIIMDTNQRFQYPSIIRSKAFDSLVMGTSTSRLLDPRALDQAFGGHFANLAVNDGRAWEQIQLLRLFIETVGPPRTVLLGLDTVWCDENADTNRITRRGFPDWIYDDTLTNDWLHIADGTALEIAFRKLAAILGLNTPRIPANGFEVFTPPEENYDADKVKQKLGNRPAPAVGANAVFLDDNARATLGFPALDWLSEILAIMPESSQKLLVFMPVHVNGQPGEGTRAAAIEAECKARTVALAEKLGAVVVDFRYPSPLTSTDTNYWDPLHYRLPIANQIVDGLRDATTGAPEATGENWRRLH